MIKTEFIPELTRLFIRQEYAKIDPELPKMLEVLTTVGAAECWHKKSTFKAHLMEVYKILKMWGSDDALARCGLMHSAYSNSFVNLAIFKPDVERSRLVELIGPEAEELTHLFCVVPRQILLQVELLDKLPLADLNPQAPPGGLSVPHIRTGEPLHVDTFRLGQFLVLTMADFAEQLMSWQDAMFGNADGRLRLEGAPDPEPRVLWPGPMMPGLWMSAVSRMGRLLVSCKQQLEAAGDPRASQLPIPPVFNSCSSVLLEADQRAARDLYWRVVCCGTGASDFASSDSSSEAFRSQRPGSAKELQDKEAALRRVCDLNPFIAEPHLMLAQLFLHQERWQEAEQEAAAALQLFLDWGTAWDKRMDWGAWVAWSRVCREAALAKSWPATPLGVLSQGMVHGL